MQADCNRIQRRSIHCLIIIFVFSFLSVQSVKSVDKRFSFLMKNLLRASVSVVI